MTRRLTFIMLFLLVAALIVVGCGGGQEKATATPAAAAKAAAPAEDPVAQGKQLFGQTCASCHGQDAKGVPNLGKDLTASAFAKGLSDADLIAFIKKGRPADDPANTTKVAMPPSGGNTSLTDDQMKAIVAYLRTLEK